MTCCTGTEKETGQNVVVLGLLSTRLKKLPTPAVCFWRQANRQSLKNIKKHAIGQLCLVSGHHVHASQTSMAELGFCTWIHTTDSILFYFQPALCKSFSVKLNQPMSSSFFFKILEMGILNLSFSLLLLLSALQLVSAQLVTDPNEGFILVNLQLQFGS